MAISTSVKKNQPNDDNVLYVKGLRKRYPNFVLKDISFDVKKGNICGFIGPNGAGKTTTIKAILGIVNAKRGEINLCGNKASDIGVVMDTPFYPEDWTVADVARSLKPFYSSWSDDAFNKHIKDFDLDTTKKIKDLSRGMKVKIQLAVALSHNAKLLILDEPTSGLDPVARDEVCNILQDFTDDGQKGVLFSTHITSDLEKIADYIVFIMNGSIVYSGTKDGLVEKYLRISGDKPDDNIRNKAIGYRRQGKGFEAMIESRAKAEFSKYAPKTISIDEIIIFMSRDKERANNE
ncbi:MAG: ABC transporter ATP-binding protein [Clostridiales bacterium]|jgi:ABC-2 type transport system ATP-binding protein|nr:ABC transporter ATP-binding protein [Clostridiales bacterium]